MPFDDASQRGQKTPLAVGRATLGQGYPSLRLFVALFVLVDLDTHRVGAVADGLFEAVGLLAVEKGLSWQGERYFGDLVVVAFRFFDLEQIKQWQTEPSVFLPAQNANTLQNLLPMKQTTWKKTFALPVFPA